MDIYSKVNLEIVATSSFMRQLFKTDGADFKAKFVRVLLQGRREIHEGHLLQVVGFYTEYGFPFFVFLRKQDKIRIEVTPEMSRNTAEDYGFKTSAATDSDCCAFAPKIVDKLPKNTIPRKL